jgi:hypothetical protein
MEGMSILKDLQLRRPVLSYTLAIDRAIGQVSAFSEYLSQANDKLSSKTILPSSRHMNSSRAMLRLCRLVAHVEAKLC